MNLRDLKYLVTVADCLHFGRAAQACHVSQPTLSMQLKKLEEFLGVQLFERTNKKVMLTQAGRDITERARRVLQECDQMVSIARAEADPFGGVLRLGIFPTLAPYLLPHVMPALRKQFPRLALQLAEEKTPELLQRLRRGELDAALLALPLREDGIESMKLFSEPFLLAVPRAHALAGRKRVKMDELQGESLLLLDDGHCLRDQALEVCHAIGAGESGAFRATSLETLRHMVAGGKAMTLMPKLAAREGDEVAYLPFADPAPARAIGLSWRATSGRQDFFRAVGEFLRALPLPLGK